jgi:hypothetical protein
MGRWEDGKMGRWEDGKMGKWVNGEFSHNSGQIDSS